MNNTLILLTLFSSTKCYNREVSSCIEFMSLVPFQPFAIFLMTPDNLNDIKHMKLLRPILLLFRTLNSLIVLSREALLKGKGRFGMVDFLINIACY
jgi:hypothetical protein